MICAKTLQYQCHPESRQRSKTDILTNTAIEINIFHIISIDAIFLICKVFILGEVSKLLQDTI